MGAGTLIADATTLVATHAGWAIVLVFLVAAAESIAVIGAVVPGTPIIVAVGAMVALGHLSIWPILVATAAGAILGDGVSYWIGHRYGDRLRRVWPFSRWPDLLTRGEARTRRRGAVSILIARFVPGIRSTVPVAAGMQGMPAGRFAAANIVSALLWAPAHVLPGVLAGMALTGLGAVSLRLGVAAALLGMVLLAAFRVARPLVVLASGTARRVRLLLAAWAASRCDLWGRLVRLATASDQAAPRSLAVLAAIALLAPAGFLALLGAVVAHAEIVQADLAILTLVGSLHTVWTDQVMLAASRLGDTVMNVSVTLVMVGWLLWRRQFALASGIAAAIVGAAGLMVAIKWSVQATRPPLLTSIAPGFTFPSGHSTMAVVVFGLLGWLVSASPDARIRRAGGGVLLPLVALIAVSRIYLAAHWPSDVVAGLMLGTAVVSTFAIVFRGAERAAVAPAGLWLAVMLVLGTIGWLRIASHLGPDLSVLRDNALQSEVLAQSWYEGGWRAMPLYRTDLGGEREEPLILQWRGSAEALAAGLRADGWQTLPEWSWASVARMLDPAAPALRLPSVPMMHVGLTPVLTLARAVPGEGPTERLVLRAWVSGRQDPRMPGALLLVASVARETSAPIARLISLPRADQTVRCGTADTLLAEVASTRTDLRLAGREGGCGGAVLLGSAADP